MWVATFHRVLQVCCVCVCVSMVSAWGLVTFGTLHLIQIKKLELCLAWV